MRRLLLWLVALTLVALASYLVFYRDRIFLGVVAAGYDLGGLTRPQAVGLLRERAAPDYSRRTVTLRLGNRVWAPTYADLGARLDVDATAQDAFAIGRRGPADLVTIFSLPFRPTNLPPVFAFDPAPFNAYLARLTNDTYVPPRNASVAVSGNTTYAVPAQPGRRLDAPAFVTLLRDSLTRGVAAPIDLPMTDSSPQVADASEAAQQAARLAGAPLSLVYGDRAWTLKPADLEPLLVYSIDAEGKLSTDLDRARLQAWVARLSSEMDRAPQDARLRWDAASKRPVATQASQTGLSLDVFASTDRLYQAARASLTAAAPPITERRAEAVVKERAPAVDSRNPDGLGIRELVWEETSLFQGSEPGRVRNIQLSAAKFDGVVIPPDATFSFNAIVGEISAATGYDETVIIVDNQSQRGAGGGVCQVSTTVFRAAFWTGLPMVERWAHGYRVSYYEQGAKPLGVEAAIFSPSLDLKFKNDTGAHLLMHTSVNPGAASLTVRLYGPKPDRQVSLEGPTVANRTPPGPPVYQDDPALAPGQQKQVEWPREGMDITYFRVVKQGERVLSREKFTSEYAATQAIYKVGKRT